MGACEQNERNNFPKTPIDYTRLNEEFNKFLIDDQIQDYPDARYNKGDIVFNSIRKEEKEQLIKFYQSNKNILINDIHNYLKNQNKNFVPNLTQQIIANEDGRQIFEQKIKKEIQSIYNNGESNKIDYLTIMIIGVTGAGKSALVNAMLKEYLAKEGVGKVVTQEITHIYQNRKVPYLHLVDTRGIELGRNFDANIIGKRTSDFIVKQYEENKGKNISNFVHCIWYCIRSDRFQEDEYEIVRNLQYTIKNSKIPILFVRTYSVDPVQDEEMRKYLVTQNLDKNFIRVLSKDVGTIKSFGLDKLLQLTLKRCKEAIYGDMKETMVQNISHYIQDKLFHSNLDIKKMVFDKMMLDVINNDKAGEDFQRYIIDIYNYNVSYYLDHKMSDRSISLIEKGEFNNHKNNYLLFCQNRGNEIFKNSLPKFANKFLDLQSKKQKEMRKVIELENIRDYDDFVFTTEQFLNNNYTYLSQKYYIDYVLKNMCGFLSTSFEKNLNYITIELMNRKEIKKLISDCFYKKFTDFEKRIERDYKVNINRVDGIDDSYYLPNKQDEQKSESYYPSKQYDQNSQSNTISKQYNRNPPSYYPSKQYDQNSQSYTISKQYNRNTLSYSTSKHNDRNSQSYIISKQFDQNSERSNDIITNTNYSNFN